MSVDLDRRTHGEQRYARMLRVGTRNAGLLVSILLCGCAGHFTEVPLKQVPKAREIDIQALLPADSSSQLKKAYAAMAAAKQSCGRIVNASDVQIEQAGSRASRDKWIGSIITGVVGAGGSVTTAVFAATATSDAKGNPNTTPSVVAGSVTAASTSLAAIIAGIFNGDQTDKIKRVNKFQKQAQDWKTLIDSLCTIRSDSSGGSILPSDADAINCYNKATDAANDCDNMAKNMPYEGTRSRG